jgi:hypothetical protein
VRIGTIRRETQRLLVRAFDGDVQLALPEGWCVTHSGARGPALDSYWLTMQAQRDGELPHVEVATVRSEVRLSDWANAFFRRRISSGEPMLVESEVQGRRTLFHEWTDGASDLVSWIIDLDSPRNAFLIVQVTALPMFADPERRSPEAIGCELLRVGPAGGWKGACDEEIVAALRALGVPEGPARLQREIDGMSIRGVRLLRRAYGCSLVEAKDLAQSALDGRSLEDAQADLVPVVEELLERGED